MNVLVYLVPLALGLGLAGLGAFVWSMKSGQFDDLEGLRTAFSTMTMWGMAEPAADGLLARALPRGAGSARFSCPSQ